MEISSSNSAVEDSLNRFSDLDKLYRGHFENVPNQHKTSVRMFVSSSFTDTIEERNILIKNVYPKLRQYCQDAYKIQFQYSDMRSGLQEELTTDHSVVESCLKELNRCCQLSLATNSIILLSHKYGSQLLPKYIKQFQFNTFLNYMSDEDTKHFKQIYEIDRNTLEPNYVLRSIDEFDKDEWVGIEQNLLKCLQKVSNICFEKNLITKKERDEFHISVTANEVYRILDNNKDKRQCMAVFFREIEDLETLSSNVKPKFVDLDDRRSVLFNELKTKIQDEISIENQFYYRVRWNDQFNKEEYLNQFQDDVSNVIQQQIDYHMSRMQLKDHFYDEVLEHAIQCQILNQRYFPREDLLIEIKNYISSNTSKLCVLYGKSGTGKSSIMAQTVKQIPQWLSDSTSTSVIIRFLGVTPLSNDIRRYLVSVMKQICVIYKLEIPDSIDSYISIEKLKEDFELILRKIPSAEHLILLFDSIDQLQSDDYECSTWLPIDYPSNVKCILSTSPTIIEQKSIVEKVEYKILEKLRSYLGNKIIQIEIDEFDEYQSKNIIRLWLQSDRRHLTTIQMNWIELQLIHKTSILFLSLLYDLTLTWRSFDQKAELKFTSTKSTEDLIRILYEQMSQKHGSVLFRRAMTYLQLSGGLSEIELEDLLTTDDVILQSIFNHYVSPSELFRIPSTLWISIRNDMEKYFIETKVDDTNLIYFFHRSFREFSALNFHQTNAVECIRRAYYAGPVGKFPNVHDLPFETNDQLHLIVNRCLTKQTAYVLHKHDQTVIYNMRRINQLCRQLDGNTINPYFVEPYFLYDYDFMTSFIQLYKMSERITGDTPYPQLRFLLTQYKNCSAIIDKYPKNFAFEISSRLISFVDMLPEFLYNLLLRCFDHCSFYMLKDDHWVVKYPVGPVYQMIQSCRNLLLLVPGKLMEFRFLSTDWLGRTSQFNLPSNEYQFAGKAKRNIISVYSNRSLLVFQTFSDQKLLFQLNINNVIHVNYFGVHEDFLFICSKQTKSVCVWNYVISELVGEYHFNELIISCTSIKKYDGILVKITLQNNQIHYLFVKHIKSIHFEHVTLLKESFGEESVFFNFDVDVFYCQDQTYFYFYHLTRSEEDRLQKIDNLPIIKSSMYQKNFFTDQRHSVLIWISVDSIVVFHSCGNYFVIPGQYQMFHVSYVSFKTPRSFLACLDEKQSKIDIFEWKFDQKFHEFRLIAFLESNERILNFTCEIDEEWGFVVYCILESGDMQKYNVTMNNYLSRSSSNRNIRKQEVDEFEIYDDFILTFDKTKCHLNIFKFKNQINFLTELHLCDSVIQSTIADSFLLVYDSKNILKIYSIDSSTELLFETTEFQFKSIQIYSIKSSFLIVNSCFQKVSEIDTKSSLVIVDLIELNFTCDSLLTAVEIEQSKLFILSDDYLSLAVWDGNQRDIRYFSLLIEKTKIIKRISISSNTLIFHEENNQISFWKIEQENKSIIHLKNFIENKQNLLILNDSNRHQWFLYGSNIQENNEINLKVLCDSFCFTEDGKYLFGVSTKESLLFMYRISDGQCLEEIFIENLSSLIRATRNRLILCCNDQLLLILIKSNENSFLSQKDDNKSRRRCALFENAEWLNCHDEKSWTMTNYVCHSRDETK